MVNLPCGDTILSITNNRNKIVTRKISCDNVPCASAGIITDSTEQLNNKCSDKDYLLDNYDHYGMCRCMKIQSSGNINLSQVQLNEKSTNNGKRLNSIQNLTNPSTSSAGNLNIGSGNGGGKKNYYGYIQCNTDDNVSYINVQSQSFNNKSLSTENNYVSNQTTTNPTTISTSSFGTQQQHQQQSLSANGTPTSCYKSANGYYLNHVNNLNKFDYVQSHHHNQQQPSSSTGTGKNSSFFRTLARSSSILNTDKLKAAAYPRKWKHISLRIKKTDNSSGFSGQHRASSKSATAVPFSSGGITAGCGGGGGGGVGTPQSSVSCPGTQDHHSVNSNKLINIKSYSNQTSYDSSLTTANSTQHISEFLVNTTILNKSSTSSSSPSQTAIASGLYGSGGGGGGGGNNKYNLSKSNIVYNSCNLSQPSSLCGDNYNKNDNLYINNDYIRSNGNNYNKRHSNIYTDLTDKQIDEHFGSSCIGRRNYCHHQHHFSTSNITGLNSKQLSYNNNLNRTKRRRIKSNGR